MLLKSLWSFVEGESRRVGSVDPRLRGAPLVSLPQFRLRLAAWFVGQILLGAAWVGIAVMAVRYWDASLWVKAPFYVLLLIFAPVGQPRYRSYEDYCRAWLAANSEAAGGESKFYIPDGFG